MCWKPQDSCKNLLWNSNTLIHNQPLWETNTSLFDGMGSGFSEQTRLRRYHETFSSLALVLLNIYRVRTSRNKVTAKSFRHEDSSLCFSSPWGCSSLVYHSAYQVHITYLFATQCASLKWDESTSSWQDEENGYFKIERDRYHL